VTGGILKVERLSAGLACKELHANAFGLPNAARGAVA
jgi:hypothetical protein